MLKDAQIIKSQLKYLAVITWENRLKSVSFKHDKIYFYGFDFGKLLYSPSDTALHNSWEKLYDNWYIKTSE